MASNGSFILSRLASTCIAISVYYICLVYGYSTIGLLHYRIVPPVTVPLLFALTTVCLVKRDILILMLFIIYFTVSMRYLDSVYHIQLGMISSMTPSSVFSMVLRPLVVQLVAASVSYLTYTVLTKKK